MAAEGEKDDHGKPQHIRWSFCFIAGAVNFSKICCPQAGAIIAVHSVAVLCCLLLPSQQPTSHRENTAKKLLKLPSSYLLLNSVILDLNRCMQRAISENSDVHYFGVLLLEIVSSERNLHMYLFGSHPLPQSSSRWWCSYGAWKSWKEVNFLKLMHACSTTEVSTCIFLREKS